MSETAYAVIGLDAHLRKDGTKAFITLRLREQEPARFSVSYEGASALAAQMNLVCRKMAELLVSSGAAEKYNTRVAEVEPFRVLSARSGLSQDGTTFVLSLQTEEGPLLEFALPPALATELLAKASGGQADPRSPGSSSIN